MSKTSRLNLAQIRAEIISNPRLVLDDTEVLKALAHGADGSLGDNVVDMRNIVLKSLEERLQEIGRSNREVVAASYENAVNTVNVQKSVLALLEPNNYQCFLEALMGQVPEAIKVDRMRILIERSLEVENPERILDRVVHGPVALCPPGSIDNYLLYKESSPDENGAVLRQVASGDPEIYDQIGPAIRSEALVRKDRGKGRPPWLLVAGAIDPNQFQPGMGTDLLSFFSAVIFSQCRRWLE